MTPTLASDLSPHFVAKNVDGENQFFKKSLKIERNEVLIEVNFLLWNLIQPGVHYIKLFTDYSIHTKRERERKRVKEREREKEREKEQTCIVRVWHALDHFK